MADETKPNSGEMANDMPLTRADHAAMGHDVAGSPVKADGEGHAATTQVQGGAEHAVPSALGFDATMLVALAMLVVIGIAIWKKVPAIIGAALDKQIAGIREQLDAATNLRNEAEAIKAEYQAKAAESEKAAVAMRAAAESEAADIIAKAKADATALIASRGQMAEAKIAAAERVAIADVRAKSAMIAAAAAEQILAKQLASGKDQALIDSAISKLN
jgi:F-type H+-transporting ATPase subunit b